MIQAISDLMIHFNFFQFLLRLLNAARLFLFFIHFISVCGFFLLIRRAVETEFALHSISRFLCALFQFRFFCCVYFDYAERI